MAQTATDNPLNDAVVPSSVPPPEPEEPIANPPAEPTVNPPPVVPNPDPKQVNPIPEPSVHTSVPTVSEPVNPYLPPVNVDPAPEPLNQSVPPVQTSPYPAAPVSAPLDGAPTMNTSPRTPVYIPAQNPPPPSSFIKPRRFPFMFITIILVLVLLGFGGSFLYFKIVPTGTSKAVIQITPPVTIVISPVQITPTVSNPFATPSSTLINPFISTTPAFSNPFDSSPNPFDTASGSSEASKSAYQNPFESLE